MRTRTLNAIVAATVILSGGSTTQAMAAPARVWWESSHYPNENNCVASKNQMEKSFWVQPMGSQCDRNDDGTFMYYWYE
ncbi:hypothetical protein [Kribbella sp. NPDC055071]